MSRKTIRWSEKKIEQFIKERRGQGEYADYVPWIKVGEFSSQGRCHRVRDIKTGRTHHFFSDLECLYYYFIIWNDSVVDIREQFPLFPRTQTESIAKELDKKHPAFAGFNIIMTTDFLLTIRDLEGNEKYIARAVKPSSECEPNCRAYEKLLIEQQFWMKHGIDYGVITENSFSKQKAKNIKYILQYYKYNMKDILGYYDSNLEYDFKISLLKQSNESIVHFCKIWDFNMNQKDGTFLNLLKMLAAHKEVPIILENTINFSNRIMDFVDINKLYQILGVEYNDIKSV